MKSTRAFLLPLLMAVATLTTFSQTNNPPPCGDDGPNRQPCASSSGTANNASQASNSQSISVAGRTLMATAAAEPTRSSEFEPNKADDDYFVLDTGGGLDTGCTYRSEGPLRITVPVNRVVGATNGDGTLQNWQAMVQNGVIKRQMTLTMPAFDVDYSQGERDEVYFNGNFIGRLGEASYLTGENNIWKLNTFRVPVEFIRFGVRNSGGEATASDNVIEIRIDQASGGQDRWCTALDWVAIGVEAMHPVVMIHGNNSSGAFYSDLGFIQPFQQAGIPFDNTINMATDSIRNHGDLLVDQITSRVRSFGARHVHIVAHSKGGLDTRDYLARTLPRYLQGLPEEQRYGVLSLITLCTPHNGSVGANYVIDANRPGVSVWESDNTIRTFLASRQSVDLGTPDLRVDFVQGVFNPVNLASLPRSMTVGDYTNEIGYYAFSADANLDGSSNSGGPTIQSNNNNGQNEVAGINAFNVPLLGIPVPVSMIPGATSTVQEVYRMMGNVRMTSVQTKTVLRPGLLFPRPVQVRYVAEVQEGQFQLNDFLVTARSASNIPRFIPTQRAGANHATIATPPIARRVIQIIRDVQSRKLGSNQ